MSPRTLLAAIAVVSACAAPESTGEGDAATTSTPDADAGAPPDADAGAPPDHALLFPIAAGDSHALIACASCHLDATDPKKVECTTCHAEGWMAPRHAGVGGFEEQSGLCLRCHADAQVDRVSGHLPFSIIRGSRHERVACLACHVGSRADKSWATDFGAFVCIACHVRDHRRQDGDRACFNCHASGDAFAP